MLYFQYRSIKDNKCATANFLGLSHQEGENPRGRGRRYGDGSINVRPLALLCCRSYQTELIERGGFDFGDNKKGVLYHLSRLLSSRANFMIFVKHYIGYP